MVTRIDPLPDAGLAKSIIKPTERDRINVATVNVRYDNGTKSSLPPIFDNPYREKPWSERKTRLIDCLLSIGDIDIIGFQEVLHDQLSDLQDLLGDEYGHVGVGRDDGKESGEYSPIFYDRRIFEVVKWGTIWLSTTPDIPSRGWDAALPRIATLLTLRKIGKNGKLVHAINTHYDHLGIKARAESSLLIRSQIYNWVKQIEKEEKIKEKNPIILFGDFNSPPEEKGYKNITSSKPLLSNQSSFYFLDSFNHLFGKQTRPYGPEHTYTDFAPPGSKNQTRIDFIMLGADNLPKYQKKGEEEILNETSNLVERASARGGWKVDKYACLDNFIEGDSDGWKGRWSDHRVVRISISKTSQ
ncbi:uncharacterized protein I206_102543 [Kwoniella pini CBS 10737]|uniref:Endonuclease/exonuclease/phosphatase n=1 Tax=Kwoniella pini CBS 10737 TaxID=1296096 RepID=A0A1B9I5P9_9TREE|nr:endonuclease/exonuclease/phosphatase [Kwoniella pini CBS 10737]OCF50837.1 endonuclease/exonuclease/phosphatase [Kwoniella pini CBS 10737]